MKVWFAQFYIEVGIRFPFTHVFQLYLSTEITALVEPSPKFINIYGSDFELMFRIGAKKSIEQNEIRGPTVFRKAKDVEYTIFLPFDAIQRDPDVLRSAVTFVLNGACAVLESLEIDTSKIVQRREFLIETICSDHAMVEEFH